MSDTTTYAVPDISCQHCVDSITKEVCAVDGVRSVDVDLGTKTVSVEGGEATAIIAAIDEAGYDVT